MIAALRKHRASWTDPSPDTSLDDEMVTLTLTEKGIISECSSTCDKLLGYPTHQLIWKHISVLLPQLANLGQAGLHTLSRLRYLSHIGYRFDLRTLDGGSLPSRLFFSEIETAGRHYLRVLIRPAKMAVVISTGWV